MKSLLFLFLTSPVFLSQVLSQKNKKPLYVFHGEKISVERFEPEVEEGVIMMDLAFKAKYKVINNHFATVPADTIEFIAYDHYGNPSFSHKTNVLIYITRNDSMQFYHCKYMYSNLYKTEDGNWAGIYNKNDYNHPSNQDTDISPERINWAEPVKIDVSQLSWKDQKKWFPNKYFRIKKDTAYAVYGNYIPELIKLKKNGYLKARGYFE